MHEVIPTIYGSFEAFVRNGEIDVVGDGKDGYAETFDKDNAIKILRQRRRLAQNVVTLSERVSYLITGASVLELATGIVKKDPQRIVKGIVGIGASCVLYRAKPYFQKKADIAGISQEAIEIARR